jgi:hypothetical protein
VLNMFDHLFPTPLFSNSATLEYGYTFNLHISSKGKSLYGHTGTTRLDISPISHVDLIHGSKIVHARQEDINLDNLVDIWTRFLEHSCKIANTFMLFLREGKTTSILAVALKKKKVEIKKQRRETHGMGFYIAID